MAGGSGSPPAVAQVASLPSESAPLIGKVVDQRFRVLGHIGSGGMADVYEVEHVLLGRRLAMKVLRQTKSSSPHLARRFIREARAASRLESEHVVSIHDYGSLPEGHPYFVMELLRGQNLRQLLVSEQRLPVVRVVNIAIDVCLGLHAAHGGGLIHRDLKPENLWLTRGDDGRELCVLLDFGVARFDGAHTTGEGVLVGTARYMSPEQIGSETPPGPCSDLFSLGVILYECLSGSSPFASDSLERTLFRILNDVPKPLPELADEVPAELWAVIERTLHKRPDQRQESALELARQLRPFAGAIRLLPTLESNGPNTLSAMTLAEDTSPEERSFSSSELSSAAPVAKPSAASKVTLLAFVGVVLLGAGALLLVQSRETPSAPTSEALSKTPRAELASAAPAVPSAALPDVLPAPAVIPTNSTPPVAASQRAPAINKPARPPTPPPPVTRSPARPAPPRPDFDGRNPYFQ
jgi:serine/threonine protein kinase